MERVKSSIFSLGRTFLNCTSTAPMMLGFRMFFVGLSMQARFEHPTQTMAAEGSLDLDQIRVVEGSLAPPKDYPFLLSTCLYPEWPFAAVKGTADSLSGKSRQRSWQ